MMGIGAVPSVRLAHSIILENSKLRFVKTNAKLPLRGPGHLFTSDNGCQLW
jgi:hypothetical protein